MPLGLRIESAVFNEFGFYSIVKQESYSVFHLPIWYERVKKIFCIFTKNLCSGSVTFSYCLSWAFDLLPFFDHLKADPQTFMFASLAKVQKLLALTV